MHFIYTTPKKYWTVSSVWSKTILITGGVSGTGLDPPSCKTSTFFLGPWLLVCQFIDISNQMETTGEVSSVEQKNLYNALLCKKNSFDL